jgi:hypothetical protein
VKPQSDAFLEKAKTLLEQAETMLRVGLADAAGRTAYLVRPKPSFSSATIES